MTTIGLEIPIEAWSSGGGNQSAAIAALICQGKLRPDVAVIADTEREVSQTWKYHEEIIVPNLRKVGLEIYRIPKTKYATVDLYGGKEKDTLLIPAFTTKTKTGKIGKLPAFCSNEWKVRVVRRFLSEMYPDKKRFNLWLGISRDEADRMRSEEGKWQYRHPLVEDGLMMSRQDCRALVRSMGWPPPPRSRCYMCPNQGPGEWADLENNYPGEFEKAMNLQAEVQKRDAQVFLKHPSGEAQGDCMSGMCFV